MRLETSSPNGTVDKLTTPMAMSDPGRHAALFDGLPRDTGALAETVQGLMIHQHIAPAYGVTLSRDQQAQSHVRAVEKILGDIAARDGRPLSIARAPGARQVGVCRHFTLLHVAMLRTQGIPARARCGFGAYFEKDKYIDHWVTEYWNEARNRWVLFDSQIDDRQRELSGSGSIQQTSRGISSWWRAMPGRAAVAEAPIRMPSASSTCTDFGSSRATSSATSPL